MDKTDKYSTNLKKFDDHEKKRLDIDRENKLNYLDLFYIEQKLKITSKDEIKMLIVELKNNIIQSTNDIIALKKLLDNDEYS